MLSKCRGWSKDGIHQEAARAFQLEPFSVKDFKEIVQQEQADTQEHSSGDGEENTAAQEDDEEEMEWKQWPPEKRAQSLAVKIWINQLLQTHPRVGRAEFYSICRWPCQDYFDDVSQQTQQWMDDTIQYYRLQILEAMAELMQYEQEVKQELKQQERNGEMEWQQHKYQRNVR